MHLNFVFQSSFTDNKNKRLKTELKKALEKNKSTATEVSLSNKVLRRSEFRILYYS